MAKKVYERNKETLFSILQHVYIFVTFDEKQKRFVFCFTLKAFFSSTFTGTKSFLN